MPQKALWKVDLENRIFCSYLYFYLFFILPFIERTNLSFLCYFSCWQICNRIRSYLTSSIPKYNRNITSSVGKLCPTLCNSMNCSSPGFPVPHYLPQFAQTHLLKLIAHWDSDATQPSHHLLPPFPPALNLTQHQGLFQWVSSFHQVAKVLQLQLQHQ